MSAGTARLATFAFTPENEALAQAAIGRYPPGRQASAVLALLTLAQQQNGGWLPQPALDYVADYLQMPPIRVYEVASFYDMFNTRPVGRTQIRVCTTTPCWLCGSDEVLKACKDTLGIEIGQSTADGRFFLREFECLGACANAPMLWVDDDYYEDLTYDSTAKAILDDAAARRAPGARLAGRPARPRCRRAARPRCWSIRTTRPSGRKGGPGKRDEEPVEKAKPEIEVKRARRAHRAAGAAGR